MSKPIPNKNVQVLTYTVKTNGSTIPDTTEVISIEVKKEVNGIPFAKITVADGSGSTGEFDESSSNTFVPGTAVSIAAGYNLNNTVIFEGIITKQQIRSDKKSGAVLVIECHDEAIKMTVGRKSIAYFNKKDSEIITTIVGNYSGLTSDISATNTALAKQVQYNTTDWDFMLNRAEMNGMIVTIANGKISVHPPDNDTSPVEQFEYGDNLLAFNASLNAVTQLASSKASSWDFTAQQKVSKESSNSYAGPGDLSSSTLSEVIGLSNYELQTTAPVQTNELTNWSSATLMKSAYTKIQGSVKLQGIPLVDAGVYITLSGLGSRFSGDHIVSSVRHKIKNGSWITEASIGLGSNVFSEERTSTAASTSGLIPGVQGLFNATVLKMHEDPDSQYRILVDIPLFDTNGDGLWARLTNFYATSGAGAFFMPEVGDEVVVGFLNEDPRYPIILGSMFSEPKNKPLSELVPDEKNTMKAIVSKSGISMQFDDDLKILTLKTPNNNTAIFDDDEQKITIKDQNNNSIVLSESGITIETDKQLTLKGNEGVSIESSGGDIELTGGNIQNTAAMEFSATADGGASLTSSATTTIEGSLVMIN